MNFLKIGAFALVGMMALNSCGPSKTQEEIEAEAQEIADELMGTDSEAEAEANEPVAVPEMDAMMAGIADAVGDDEIYAVIDPYLATEDVKDGMGYMMFEDESTFEVTKHRGMRFTIRIGGDSDNEIDVYWEGGQITKMDINMEIE